MEHQDNATSKQKLGYHAENHVCHYLQKAGLTLLMRNFRCKQGEIDLIMRENDTIIFVEVRYRHNHQYGSAVESITVSKQNRIRRAAQIYLQRYDPDERFFWRYDWAGVSTLPNGKFAVEWIPNAWEEDY
ncbi:MAG: YraN family protein [Gammaproteobacteria bacterium]